MEKPAQHLLQNEEQAWKPIFNNVVVEEELLVDFIEENMRNLEMEILLKSENPSNLKFNSLLNEKFKYCFSSLPEEDTSNWSLLSLFHLLKENCTNLFKYPAQFCSNSFEIRSTLKLPPLLPLFLFLVSPILPPLPFLILLFFRNSTWLEISFQSHFDAENSQLFEFMCFPATFNDSGF